MATLRGMGYPDLTDYNIELLWDGGSLRKMLVIETPLEIRSDQPGFDEKRLRALAQFVESYRDKLIEVGFVDVPPIALRHVDA
jgi:hypothetical protein